VGEFNQKYFILFLFYIGNLISRSRLHTLTYCSHLGVTSLYVLSFVIWTLVVFPHKTDTQMYVWIVASRTMFDRTIDSSVHSIILCIESCLFGLFVVAIFVDQVQSITSDRSVIDTLKASESARTSPQTLPPTKVLFRRVFGPGKQQPSTVFAVQPFCV
jgi:hypothetical protein